MFGHHKPAPVHHRASLSSYVEFDAHDDRHHTLTVIEQASGNWLLAIGAQDERGGTRYQDVVVSNDDLDTLIQRVRPAIRRNRQRQAATEGR